MWPLFSTCLLASVSLSCFILAVAIYNRLVRSIKSAFLLFYVQRSYAAQAAHKVAPAEGLQVSKLPSGTVVASLENNSPISRVAVFLR